MEDSVHLNYQIKDPLHGFIHELRLNALVRAAKGALAGVNTPRILDVGCGRGELMSRLGTELNAEVFGIDIDEKCVELSQKYGTVWQGTVESLWESSGHELAGSFDLVVSSHSMEHMPEACRTMKLVKRLSRGYVLIAVPNPHFLPNLMRVAFLQQIPNVNKGHFQSWDAPHLKQFLETQVGMEVVSWHADFVKLAPGNVMRRLALKSGILGFLEGRLAPRVMPRLANSLIATCDVRAA